MVPFLCKTFVSVDNYYQINNLENKQINNTKLCMFTCGSINLSLSEKQQ